VAGSGPLNRMQLLALLGLIIVLGAALSVLLSGAGGFGVPPYVLGDIARTDILIPRDVLIEDREATEARKAEARVRALPVYQFNPSREEEQRARIKSFFTASRMTLGLGPEGGTPPKGRQNFRALPAATRTQLLTAAKALGLGQPLESLLDFFVREAFSTDLEARLTALAKAAAATLIVPDGRPPSREQAALSKFNPLTAKEETVPLEQVLTLTQARNRIAETISRDKEIPAPWKPHLRRILQTLTEPNLQFDEHLSQARQERDAANVDHVLRRLKQGKVVLRQGDEVGPDHLEQLDAIRRLSPVRTSAPQAIGTAVLIALWLTLFLFLLRALTPNRWRYFKLAALCLFTLTVSLLLLKLSWFTAESLSQNLLTFPLNEKANFLFALPFAHGSMLITLLSGVPCALLFAVGFAILAGQAVGADAHAFFYILTVNLAGILLIRRTAQRIGIVGAGFRLGLVSLAAFFLLQLAQQAPLDPLRTGFGATLALFSGLVNALFLLFMLPLCERLFQVSTEFRLSELGNLNLPIIREMIKNAPGTYNHSIAVGTLCEGAAKAVGLNPLFLRITSLYHDIGKTVRPAYFIENQHGENPHDTLAPLESVALLQGHVLEGVRMALKAKLPPELMEMIPQHHGTRLMRYFQEKASRQARQEGGAIPAEAFRYQGPKPQTKAACVLMIADQIEAASRTLDSHAPERLAELIRQVIADGMEDGQFRESDITLADLDRIAASFLETLSSLYHGRIAYPESNGNGKPPALNGDKPVAGDKNGPDRPGRQKAERGARRFFNPRPAAAKKQGRLFRWRTR
jgi:hypothetical protein